MESGPVRGPVCGVENCRSRRYEEGEDGYLYCENGHRKGELLRGQDDDDFTTAARTTTRKKKDEDELIRVPKYLKGRQAFDLYLKSLQLVLRHQIWYLIHDKGLPAELETVILDLWALRIAQLGDRIPSESLEYDSQSELFTTESDTETEGRRSKRSTQDRKLKGVPNLIDCLCLCYLGTLTLRLPITPGDISAWVTNGKMPYRRAIRLLPTPMRDKLPAYYHPVLDPNTLLSFKRFYSKLIDAQINFEREHGILWPPLNVPILLFRYMKELALPLTLYDATIRLGNLLAYDFAFSAEARKQLGVRDLPETRLISCLVVCVKLLYPLDSERRSPRSDSEPAATMFDWAEWSRQTDSAKMEQRGDRSRYTIDELTQIEEKDVFNMIPEQLDQYLDFYADNFLDETQIQANRDDNDFRRTLYELFPIESSRNSEYPSQPSENLENRVKLKMVNAVHTGIRPNIVGEEDGDGAEVLKPGQMYWSYKKEKYLPELVKRFYEEAAKIVGMELGTLILGVCSVERAIEKWRMRQREAAKAG